MDPRSSEPDWNSMDEDDGMAPRMFGRQRSLVDEGMKGVADPLLSQEPTSVLPSYASLMDTDVGQDFSEDKLMNSGNLYSLYLLNSDSPDDFSLTNGLASSPLMPDQGIRIKKETSDDEEEIDVENDISKSELSAAPVAAGAASPRKRKASSSSSQLQENGEKAGDALFEGMPFYELQGKEVGPCAYCNMWRTIRYMSYCGRYPFCSVNCTKKFAVYKREQGELLEKVHEDDKLAMKLKVPTLFEEHKPRPLFPTSPINVPVNGKKSCNGIHGNVKPDSSSLRFDWPAYLEEQDAEAAPVKCFHHAALSKEWKANLIGALVEVHNRDPGESKDSFWVARIIKVAGYKAKLRFEGYGMDNSHDFWAHLCKTECYAINGAVKAGMKLKPPKGVMERLGDKWLEHLARISHSRSPTYSTPKEKLKECFGVSFKKDMKLEVVYKRQVPSTCVATVKNVVGDRIHVQYDNCKDPSKDFWFHRMSPLIHPVGWSQRVGHPLVATAAYKSEALDKGRQRRGGPHDAPWELFQFPDMVKQDQSFRVGMKLEVIDPLKLSQICIGTVMRVLEEGYLMIGVDGCLADQNTWFCYHSNSSLLLPVGFCEYHHIDLTPPKDFQGNFDWDDYLRNTNSVAAPVELFHQKTTNPGFKAGHKLEAVDLIESGLICAATAVKSAGPLLRVHFDGWDSSYDQWVDCQSPDIYPVGWCEMVGYPLQPPRISSMLEYTAPLPVFKHNGKKIKIAPGLRPDNKKRRSLSISLGNFTPVKPTEANLDSIYAFSDDEGVSGYQELLKAPSKPPSVNKKEKKEKKEKKRSKAKHHKNHHHHHHKHNGKPESLAEMKSNGSELKHLLTTINVDTLSVTSHMSSPKSPKAEVTVLPMPSHKKHKKSSKKDRSKLSKTEASILDGIFAAMNKEAELYAKLNPAKSQNDRPISECCDSIQRTVETESALTSPSVTTSSATSNVQSSFMSSFKPVVGKCASPDSTQPPPMPSMIQSQLSQKFPQTSNLSEQTSMAANAAPKSAEQKIKLAEQKELTPPTLNKMQDVPLPPVTDASSGDALSEMPPLIPAGELEPSPIPDTNKFQDAFLLQLAESLKATKSKSEKNSKTKPKKARVKDKDKEASKKSAKKEAKNVKSKKEGKSKEKKQQQQQQQHQPLPFPFKPKTSHLAERLKRPGSLDLTNIDPQGMVNGFYMAGASSGVGSETSRAENIVHSRLPNPTTPVSQPAAGVPAAALQQPPAAAVKKSGGGGNKKALLSAKANRDSQIVKKALQQNLVKPKVIMSEPEGHILPHSLKLENQGNGLMSPGPVNKTLRQGLVNDLMNPGQVNKTHGPGLINDLMSPGSVNKTVRPGLVNELMNPGQVNKTLRPGLMNDLMSQGSVNKTLRPGLVNELMNPGQVNKTLRPGLVNDLMSPRPVNKTQGPGLTNDLISPRPVNKTQGPGLVNDLMSPRPVNKTHGPGLVNDLMNPGLMNDTMMSRFDFMDDDILQNCIDPNLLHKPSSRVEQRSQSLDTGLLHQVEQKHQSPPPVDVYQFMPNTDDSEPLPKPAPSSSKKATATKTKAAKAKPKPKPKPKPKKKKAANANSKPVPRGRSNSLPSVSNTTVEAQKFLANVMINMDMNMMQDVFSGGNRPGDDTLLELKRTQQHIVSSILHDHAHQAAPPEQLFQRQRAAMIMQEKFRELQQLQVRMNMAQQQQNSPQANQRPPMPALVELRRPPSHMRFPNPQAMMLQQQQQQQQMQVSGIQMHSNDPRLHSPHHGQPIVQPMMSPQGQLPPLSPQQSPNPMHGMVPGSPKSMIAKGMKPPPSPKSKLPPRSPKSVPVPSSKSMLPNSPTSMPPPSPSMPPPSPSMPPPSRQSGPPSNNSMIAASPQSMMPQSSQGPVGPQLQARLQQTSPTPGPTSPIMMMQGRPHSAAAGGMLPNQRMMTTQARMQSASMMVPHHNMPPSPHSMLPSQASPQPVLSPRGMLSPPRRFPTSHQSQMPHGSTPGDRNAFPYRSPLPSPQSSPTGTPTQRLPPLHSLLHQPGHHQMPTSPHGMPSSLPSPVSNPASSPIQFSHSSPNSLQNQMFQQRGMPATHNQIHQQQQQHQIPQQQHPMSPGQQQQHHHPTQERQYQLQQHMMPGHFQGNVPIHHMARPGGFPVRMGYQSPPPGYVSPTAGSIPRRPSFGGMAMNKMEPVSSTELQMSGQHPSPHKVSVGIMNPWDWSIADVMKFIAEAGEASCAEPFRRQKIDGPKFMSLSKEELANLTGMKVASSLKIYQQIVRLRKMFPPREQANDQQPTVSS